VQTENAWGHPKKTQQLGWAAEGAVEVASLPFQARLQLSYSIRQHSFDPVVHGFFFFIGSTRSSSTMLSHICPVWQSIGNFQVYNILKV